MVRRKVPLSRRLRAAKGKIVLAGFWLSAAMFCLVLLLVSPPTHPNRAVAVSRTFSITAPYSGRLAQVKVAPQQVVEAGTVLAVIEEPGLTQMIAAAEAELRALEAQLAAEEADRGRKFSRDLEDARSRWLAARVDLERITAELTILDEEVGRLKAPGVDIPAAQAATVILNRDAAKAELAARTAEVAALSSGYDDARARAGLLNSEALKASVEAAAVNLEALRVRADANVVRAHVNGVVESPRAPIGRDGRTDPVTEEVFPVAGQWVQAGVPMLNLTETSAQDAVVYVDAARAHALAPGQTVAVRSSGGDRYQATIRAVGPSVEQVPMRQLNDVAVQEWGVPVTLQVLDRVLMPGEALAVEF